jgi:hypothetical protein
MRLFRNIAAKNKYSTHRVKNTIIRYTVNAAPNLTKRRKHENRNAVQRGLLLPGCQNNR